MKQIALTTAFVAALAGPVAADEQDGFSLMEEGARLLFRGLLQEMEPAMKELEGLSDQLEPALRGFVQNMGPALGEFLETVDDFSNYHAPEILPNGDIILRRKTPAEILEGDPDAEVEL